MFLQNTTTFLLFKDLIEDILSAWVWFYDLKCWYYGNWQRLVFPLSQNSIQAKDKSIFDAFCCGILVQLVKITWSDVVAMKKYPNMTIMTVPVMRWTRNWNPTNLFTSWVMAFKSAWIPRKMSSFYKNANNVGIQIASDVKPQSSTTIYSFHTWRINVFSSSFDIFCSSAGPPFISMSNGTFFLVRQSILLVDWRLESGAQI